MSLRFPDDTARQHYYGFAHRVLPNAVLRNVSGFRKVALVDGGLQAMRRMWLRVAEAHGIEEDESGLLDVSSHDCAGRFVVLVKPPPAEHIAEAHFIAIVIDRADEAFVRYVVLEHSWEPGGAPRTVLAEWTKESHINYGDGPQPVAEDFLRTVCERFTAVAE